jgi:hypothetical protein
MANGVAVVGLLAMTRETDAIYSTLSLAPSPGFKLPVSGFKFPANLKPET